MAVAVFASVVHHRATRFLTSTAHLACLVWAPGCPPDPVRMLAAATPLTESEGIPGGALSWVTECAQSSGGALALALPFTECVGVPGGDGWITERAPSSGGAFVWVTDCAQCSGGALFPWNACCLCARA